MEACRIGRGGTENQKAKGKGQKANVRSDIKAQKLKGKSRIGSDGTENQKAKAKSEIKAQKLKGKNGREAEFE